VTGGPGTTSRWRALYARAVARPPFDEPLDAARQRAFWVMTGMVSMIAIVVDVGLALGLRGEPGVSRATLDTFAAIVIPVLAAVVLLARASEGRARGRLALAAGMVGVYVSVVAWIQVTGTLSSYFLVAAAMLVAAHRALLSWSAGVFSLAVLCAMHAAGFALEEADALARAPLFRSAPGPVYETAALRWSVLASIFSVYAMTWMGANVLMWSLRSTERALASAERRLAAVAEGAREGRLTGREIGGYRLLEVIGRGGMAEVYRGARAGDEAHANLAIKVVHPHLVDDADLVARVRREAEIASRLPASVTPAVRDVQLAGPGERFVVLDHLDGEDLAALLRRRGRLPPAEAIPLLAAACRAVDVVHAAGVVHRDLKPQNLFVLPGGDVRVLDFGVARIDDRGASLTRVDVVLGTPGYIAPEMLSGSAAVGPEAEVFALGVVAYQALTGERPFPADGVAAVARDTPPPSRLQPGLPPALDVVLALALAPAPTRRYQRAGELALDLERALAGTLPDEVAARLRARPGSLDDTIVARRGER
jgi:serine/threonine-protein kinase